MHFSRYVIKNIEKCSSKIVEIIYSCQWRVCAYLERKDKVDQGIFPLPHAYDEHKGDRG